MTRKKQRRAIKMLSNANVVYENDRSYLELINQKDWLTSSEAHEYIRKKCPHYFKYVIGNTYSSQKYIKLYQEARDDRIVSCKTWTAGGTAVRFYSKESINHREREHAMEPEEYEIYRCKREISFARERINEDRELIQQLKTELAEARKCLC